MFLRSMPVWDDGYRSITRFAPPQCERDVHEVHDTAIAKMKAKAAAAIALLVLAPHSDSQRAPLLAKTGSPMTAVHEKRSRGGGLLSVVNLVRLHR